MSVRSRWRALLTKNSKVPPFRLGIWCDYNRTLTPYGSVGVIVHNLVEGIFQLDEPVEIVLLIRAGEEQVVSRLKALGGDRLHLLPEAPGPTYLQRIVRRLILTPNVSQGGTNYKGGSGGVKAGGRPVPIGGRAPKARIMGLSHL
jgi:hypothetical protein